MIALPIIRTARLTLRAMTFADAADMFAYAGDEEVARYVTWSPHKSVEDSREFLRSILAGYEQGSVYNLGIELNETRQMIGTVGVVKLNSTHRFAELGWAIGRAYWNRGYMTEAAAAIVDHLFVAEDLHRIEAACDPANPGSAKVMTKIGMTFEGRMRDCRFVKGQFVTLDVYSLLRREWKALK